MALLLQEGTAPSQYSVVQQGADGQDIEPVVCLQPDTTTLPPPPLTTSPAMSPSLVPTGGIQLPVVIGVCVGSLVFLLLILLILLMVCVHGCIVER